MEKWIKDIVGRVRGALRDRSNLGVILLLLIPNLVVWVVVFPGYFQADHQARIAAMASGWISQCHSVLWQLCAFPFLYMSPSYGFYGLVQIGLFVICASYSILKMKSMNFISDGGAVIVAAIFAFSPSYLMYNELYCSDMVYAFLLMPLTVKLMDIAKKKNEGCSKWDFFSLFLLIFFAVLLRKNAILLAAVIPVMLFVLMKSWRRIVLSCFAGMVALLVATNAFFTFGLGAAASPSQEMLAVPANQIACVYAREGKVPPEAASYLESIRSPEEWANCYREETADYAKAGLTLTSDLIVSWLRIVAANPELCFHAYVQMMSPYWELTTASSNQASALAPFYVDFGNHDVFTLDFGSGISEEYAAQFTHSISDDGAIQKERREIVAGIVNRIRSANIPILSDAARLIWFNRGLTFYLCFVCLLIALWKKRLPQFLLVAAPILCTFIGLLAFSPVALMRYSMEMYYALPLLVVFCVGLTKGEKGSWLSRRREHFLG